MVMTDKATARGLIFAVDQDTAEALLALEGDPEGAIAMARREADALLSGNSFEPVYELDLAWQGMQRCLGGTPPLDRAILGGLDLGDGETHVRYKAPPLVREVAKALEWFTEEDLRERCGEGGDGITPSGGGRAPWETLWYYFAGLLDFYLYAAREGLALVFSTAGAPEAWSASRAQLGQGAHGSVLVSLDEDTNVPPSRWWLNLNAPPVALTLCVGGPGVPRELLAFLTSAGDGSGGGADGERLAVGDVGGVRVDLVVDTEADGHRVYLLLDGGEAGGVMEVELDGRRLEDLREALRRLVADVGLCEDLEAIVCGGD
jgi:hypothetical protein